VNISRHALERFENGALGLSSSTIAKLCDALDIDTVERARRDLRRHVEAARGALSIVVSKRIETLERSA
jgi:hypothetical protein